MRSLLPTILTFAALAAGTVPGASPARAADPAVPAARADSAANDRYGPVKLDDGTTSSQWVLGNGLRVMVRDVPGSRAVAVAVGYGFGSDHDPDDLEGLAVYLAELEFTGPAGDLPARTREEIAGMRPLGWDLKVAARAVVLSEVGSVEQFPGVLAETAVRMRGVRVTKQTMEAAYAQVHHALEERYATRPEYVLHFGTRLVGTGAGFQAVQGYSNPRGIAKLSQADLQQRMAILFTPANAVLSISGDVGAFDLPRLTENLFGDIPAGRAAVPGPLHPLRHAELKLETNRVNLPLGVIGVIAPALSDTSHPAFALHAMLFGSACSNLWGPPPEPLTASFSFQLLDEPDLVRYYPPVMELHPEALTQELLHTLLNIMPMTVRDDHMKAARQTLEWLVGGPLNVQDRKRTGDPRLLSTLAVANASRRLLAPESFWIRYRAGLEHAAPDINRWRDYFTDEAHQVRLMAVPVGR